MSRNKKRATLEEKYQLLRSVTNSNATNKTSILVDASKHIQELKNKVERINQDLRSSSSSSYPIHEEDDNQQSSFPKGEYNEMEEIYNMSVKKNHLYKVSVETLEKGFLVNVFSERNCPGLMVSILEAFEELGLEVLDAKASCTDRFELEAVGEEIEGVDSLDAQVVRQAVLQAIRIWRDST